MYTEKWFEVVTSADQLNKLNLWMCAPGNHCAFLCSRVMRPWYNKGELWIISDTVVRLRRLSIKVDTEWLRRSNMGAWMWVATEVCTYICIMIHVLNARSTLTIKKPQWAVILSNSTIETIMCFLKLLQENGVVVF